MTRPTLREAVEHIVANVLVVDDSVIDRTLAGRLLQQDPRFAVSFAENGREALKTMRASAPGRHCL